MKMTLTELGFANPFPQMYPFYALIEVAGNRAENAERLYELIGTAEDLVIDGVVAQDEKQN